MIPPAIHKPEPSIPDKSNGVDGFTDFAV